MTLVDYAFDRGCARVTLAQADRGNPLDEQTIAALFDAVRRAHLEHARVIVIGARGRFFSVGGDLTAFAAASDMPTYVDDLADALHRLVSELMRSPAVVISAVQGAAAGAGFPLAAAADIVVAAESASFTLAYTRVGLSNDGSSSLLGHTLGLHTVLRLALLNDSLTAEEARQRGLVARVAPDAELESTIDELVETLLAGSASAFAAAKQLAREAAEPAPESVMRREALAIRQQASVDAPEGVRAFLEKRPPRYAG